MISKAIKILLGLSLFISPGCKYHGLELISKPASQNSISSASNKKIKFDTLTHADKIIGEYNYDIINGFEGIYLEVNNQNKFVIEHWTDVVGGIKSRNKGKWLIEDKQLKLKYNTFNKRYFHFYVMSLGKLTFMVPEQNMNMFFEIANNNSEKLDIINKSYDDLDYKSIYSAIDFFRNCCLLKMKNRN